MFPNGNGSGGGTNFQQFSPGYATGNTSSASLVTVLNITGSGLLASVSQSTSQGGSSSGTLKVTIDGVVVINDSSFSTAGTSSNRVTELTLMYTFKSSLLIEHAVTNTQPCSTKVAYLVN